MLIFADRELPSDLVDSVGGLPALAQMEHPSRLAWQISLEDSLVPTMPVDRNLGSDCNLLNTFLKWMFLIINHSSNWKIIFYIYCTHILIENGEGLNKSKRIKLVYKYFIIPSSSFVQSFQCLSEQTRH